MARTSVASYVDDLAARGGEIAFEHRRGLRSVRWSYARVASAARRFARELEARGVAPGDRVLLWGPNTAEWVAAFYGCALRGAIAVPLDRTGTADFAARVADRVAPRLAVVGREIEGAIPNVAAIELESLEEEIASRSDAPVAPLSSRDDTLEIVFTSGTTAEPKGVKITHANVLASLEPIEREIARYLKWERFFHPIRFLDLLPLSHVFGQFMALFVPHMLGGLVVFDDALAPTRIVETIRSRRISVLVAVPRILESLRDEIEREYADAGELDRLRRAIDAAGSLRPARRMWRFRRIHRRFGWKFWAFVSGGATLDEATERFWRGMGFAVVQGYGMTETASLVSLNHPFRMSHGSIGKVMPGREIKLDEATGEILVRGENVSPGYWGEETPSVDAEGWLRTGDLGALDAEGNLYFVGRSKEVIVTAAGVNLHPEDVEAALDAEPEIRASVVVGVEGAYGPEPAAALILTSDEADAEAAVARANASLAEPQRIRRWIVWPDADFPRTSTQKIKRREVAAALEGEQARSPLDDLIAHAAGSARGEVAATATLAGDLGLDSLARVELLSAIEDRYQLEIDEGAFTSATSVADVERLVRAGAVSRDDRPYPYPGWARNGVVRFVRTIFFHLVTLPVALVMAKPRYTGRERLAALRGPALFVANHVTSGDAALVMYALPFRYRTRLAIAMEGEMLRRFRHPPSELGVVRRARDAAAYWLVAALFNVFSLPQQSGFRRSFAYAGEAVEAGESVLVFPEGRRTPDGNLHEFRAGAGVLAAGLGVPVVPIYIAGLSEMKRRGIYFAPFGLVRVTIGEPIAIDPADDPAQIARHLERRVADLARDL
jgi:long-chain acyl-CoA synthetase